MMNTAKLWLSFLLRGDCGHACEFHEIYRFVPEAECPIHDTRFMIGLLRFAGLMY